MTAAEVDEKIHWLIDFLKSHRNEKILVICKTAQTAIQLEQILREKEAIRSAVSMRECRLLNEIARRLILQILIMAHKVLLEFKALVLKAEISNLLVISLLFDLPENPDLLEQCIGRLDRIGQMRDVQILCTLPIRFCTARFSTLVS